MKKIALSKRLIAEIDRISELSGMSRAGSLRYIIQQARIPKVGSTEYDEYAD